MIVRCFAPICRAGSVCYRQLPESIGLLEALDHSMPIPEKDRVLLANSSKRIANAILIAQSER
jgi:hypothetical protein